MGQIGTRFCQNANSSVVEADRLGPNYPRALEDECEPETAEPVGWWSALLTALSFFGLSTALLSRQALVASAGPDQTGVFVGSVVNLTGAGSVGATTYTWTFLSRPTGSAAVLLIQPR